LYLDIIPDRGALARYGLRIGDVERVIEAAIGGAPITTTIEGRNRFSVNVRYPRELRSDVEALERVLVPSAQSSHAFIPLGQLAKIEVAEGPPMVRDEAGLL